MTSMTNSTRTALRLSAQGLMPIAREARLMWLACFFQPAILRSVLGTNQ